LYTTSLPQELPSAPVADRADRRASVRYPCSPQTLCRIPRPLSHEACLPATVRDVSTGGISVIVAQWFGPGSLLRIDLENTARGFSRTLFAQVMHAALQGDGRWFIGCALLHQLSPDELRALLA
jgi:hypothetical protein